MNQLANDLKGEVNKSLKRENGEGVVSSLKYRISNQVLQDVDGLVTKIEEKRYDSALCDTLKALIQVYTDPDPIGKVLRSEHGQVNIEVKSAHSIGEEAKMKKMCNDPKVNSESIIGPHAK